MSRTERREPADGQVGGPIRGRCFAERALNAALLLPPVLSLLAALAHFSESIMLVTAVLLALLGRLYLYSVRVRQGDPRYMSDPNMRQLLQTARRFAMRWIWCGAGLAVFVLLVHAPFPIAVIGALLSLFTFVNGIAIEGDIAALREFRPDVFSARGSRGSIWADRISRVPLIRGAARLCRRRALVGDIGLGLFSMLLAAICASTIFAGLAVGEVVVFAKGEGDSGQKSDKKRPQSRGIEEALHEGESEGWTLEQPTYAELCTNLPNPLDIDHGLGELFHRAGALIAGCGRLERSVSGLGSVWHAEGVCSGVLRSLAVASPDYAPVLLFGEAAAFARRAAREGELLFADVAEPAAGVVYAVGTTAGTFFFAASSPVFGPVPEDAVRCTEAGPTSSLTELSPDLALPWLCQVERTGWAWPIVDGTGESIAFLDEGSDTLVESAECGEILSCEVVGESCEAPGDVTLAALAQYMPPHRESP